VRGLLMSSASPVQFSFGPCFHLGLGENDHQSGRFVRVQSDSHRQGGIQWGPYGGSLPVAFDDAASTLPQVEIWLSYAARLGRHGQGLTMTDAKRWKDRPACEGN